VPCTGIGTRCRPVPPGDDFVLVPHTDWPTGPGRLLLEFGQRAKPQRERAVRGVWGDWQRAEVATEWSMTARWQAGMGCASGLILEPHMYILVYR
jgi:hypothetical protein